MRAFRPLLMSCLLLAPGAAAAQPVTPVSPRPSDGPSPAAWLVRYQESHSGPEETEEWSRRFKVGSNGSLDLSNMAGSITIAGAPGDEVQIDAIKRVRAKDPAEAKRLLDALGIDAVESGGRVQVTTTFPRSHKVRAEVDYTVRVPWTVAVSARTVAGDIEASKIKGEVRLETVSGDIVTTGLAQLTRAKSVSGDVTITEATAGDVLSLGTVSGDLVARRLKARSVELQTVSGDLSLLDTVCERAQVRSVSGNVEFGGQLARNGRYEFGSHSGDVRIFVAGPAGFDLSASSFSGDLRSELALNNGQGTSERWPVADHAGPGKHELRGIYGDGSALLVIKTFSGSVTIGASGNTPKEK